jgi:hypothetical protein
VLEVVVGFLGLVFVVSPSTKYQSDYLAALAEPAFWTMLSLRIIYNTNYSDQDLVTVSYETCRMWQSMQTSEMQ